jgi:predicted AlkP superfamily pyrophosphatase or phosphodiesterase
MKKLAALAALVVALSGYIVAQTPKPILILISVDGFRGEYFDRLPVPNLKALAARGVRATGLIPSFPTLTFPNHYTLVTGLYPAHHGIVSNNIRDTRVESRRFSMANSTVIDARWWSGEPIWVTAAKQHLRTAAMFWPGSEAPIGGLRPTYFRAFDGGVAPEARVMQVLSWLALPESQRPSFSTLYFDDMDHAGHDTGPYSNELSKAGARVDAAIGTLVAGIRNLGLEDRTTIVAVSDHGMTDFSPDRTIYLDDYINLDDVELLEAEGLVELQPKPGLEQEILGQLRKAPHLRVWTRDTAPARLHYTSNARIPSIIGLSDDRWFITTHSRVKRRLDDRREFERGGHGFDPEYPSMHGLFVAAGPTLRSGVAVQPFQNIHVYELLCAVLKITPAKNDGDPKVARGFLR